MSIKPDRMLRVEAEYSGFLWLEPYATDFGVSVDQLNFFVCQIVALILAGGFRTVLHPLIASKNIRHFFGAVVGLVLVFFCFRYQVVHIILMPTICYGILKYRPTNFHYFTLLVALLYLSWLHWGRLTDGKTYAIDVTGPMMVITMKVTSLAFSLYDGIHIKEYGMTATQKKLYIKEVPDWWEYFSYVLFFPSILAGPIIYYRDYIHFIEGDERLYHTDPNPAILKKGLLSLLCCGVFLFITPTYSITELKDLKLGFFTLYYHLLICTTLVRFKYYFAWIMAETVCNNAGIGYTGQDENGEKWDGVSNVNILDFEFSTSLKGALEAWNKGTNLWLRYIVYERFETLKVPLTYLLSAIWHGFFPGYYLTFLTGALFTYASRIVRHHVRPIFQRTADAKIIYDTITFIVTRFAIAYATFPFVLYEFWASYEIYKQIYWILHVLAGLVVGKDYIKDYGTKFLNCVIGKNVLVKAIKETNKGL